MRKISKDLKPIYSYDLIRVGNINDGGYLLSQKTLKNASCLISLGIGLDISFEKDFYRINNNNIFMFDRKHSKYYFKEQFLISLNEIRRLNFLKPIQIFRQYIQIKKFINKHSFNTKNITYNSITEILNKLKFNQNILIKVDIEGSEYRTLECITNYQSSLVGLIIEFHDVDLHQELIRKFIKSFSLKLTHVHANNFGIPDKHGNPTVLEMTFEKDPNPIKDILSIPNKLDNKNNPSKEDFYNYFE